MFRPNRSTALVVIAAAAVLGGGGAALAASHDGSKSSGTSTPAATTTTQSDSKHCDHDNSDTPRNLRPRRLVLAMLRGRSRHDGARPQSGLLAPRAGGPVTRRTPLPSAFIV